MRLLSPQKVKDENRERLERDKKVLNDLSLEISGGTDRLNRLREEHNLALVKQENELSEFTSQCSLKKSQLLKEIASLELKKSELLKPVDVEKKRLQEKELALNEQQEKIIQSWKEVQQKQIRQREIDEMLANRERNIGLERVSVSAFKDELDKRDTLLKESEKLLNDRLIKSQKSYEAREALLEGKKSELLNKESSILAREALLIESEEKLSRKNRAVLLKELRLGKTYKSLKDKGLI